MRLPEMRGDRSAPGRHTLLSDDLPELRDQNGQKIKRQRSRQGAKGAENRLIAEQTPGHRTPSEALAFLCGMAMRRELDAV